MNIENLIEMIISEAERLQREDKPYIAFILLTLVIEIFGKCLDQVNNWNEAGHSQKQFCNAIDNLQSLQAYKKFDNKNNNDLYRVIRCGLHHSGFPTNTTVRLSSQHSDLNNNIIGCADFCDDVKNAFTELKQINNQKLSDSIMTIDDNTHVTGATMDTTIKSCI